MGVNRLWGLWLAAGMCFALSSCAGQPEAWGRTPLEAAEAVMDSQTELPALQQMEAGEAEFDACLSGYYQIDTERVLAGVICCAEGMEAAEVVVLELTDEAEAQAAAERLEDYREKRQGDFAGYAPAQAELVEQGRVVVQGRCAALLICPDGAAAEAAFLDCFGAAAPEEPPVETAGPSAAAPAEAAVPPETSRPAPTPQAEAAAASEPVRPPAESRVPGEDGVPEAEPTPEAAPEPEGGAPQETAEAYDHDAVVTAWRRGDDSGLSEKNRQILEMCRQVIEQVISEGMSDYDRELAIHDWIIQWADYDQDAASHAPDAQPHPDRDNPYGLLAGRRAVCSGYTSTFQLFMDLLEIPCITVEGTAGGGTQAHAWNMVELDGEWYCVDVTWDDPVGFFWDNSLARHTYFNVTSETLRDAGHAWEAEGIPEAAATEYRWRG